MASELSNDGYFCFIMFFFFANIKRTRVSCKRFTVVKKSILISVRGICEDLATSVSSSPSWFGRKSVWKRFAHVSHTRALNGFLR